MKIAVENKIPFIKGRLEPVAEVEYLAPEEFTRERIKCFDAVVVRTRTRCGEELLAGTNVRTVVTATIGTDHIDLGWCSENGIRVLNCAGCNAPGVAQYVWTALQLTGFNPADGVLGIVGLGNVGSIVADWGMKMGVKMLICDPPKERTGAKVDFVPFERVLTESDAITLHVPLTTDGEDATRHMFGKETFGKMKSGALLINSSRGPVADNSAWFEAIAAGKVRGVVDVWEGEPEISLPLLEAAEYGTPHIAGYSLEGKQRATRMALEALEEVYGFSVDKSGLAPSYAGINGVPEMSAIASGYDLATDSRSLKSSPSSFELLRSTYCYRPEFHL